MAKTRIGARGGETAAVIDMLRRLVAFDTTSHLSNLALIDFVADHLADHEVGSMRIGNDDGTKASLIAVIGPPVPGGVVLSGHTDVVPVAGQDWATDPFTLAEVEGRLHGRGAADMKGFLATALALVPEFLDADIKVPIILAFSYDEEVGCLGAGALIRKLVADVPAPFAAIVGEPSSMAVAGAHRGIDNFVTTVKGRPGHASATHKGVSAVAYAAECVAFLNRLEAELRAVRASGDFDPPFTTINAGRIAGGSATNVIAPECRIDWECRTVPGVTAADVAGRLNAFVAEQLLPGMQGIAPEADVTTTPVVSVPGFAAPPDSPATALALSLTGQNHPTTVPFGSEAGMFESAGIPTVICGPGSPDQAHRANEYVTAGDLEDCAEFMRGLARWAATRAGDDRPDSGL